MTRATAARPASPRLAETARVVRGGSGQRIALEGYGPARRVVAGIALVALAIGAALPVRAATDDLATGLAALGALALIAGETGGNALPGVAVVRDAQEAGPWPVSACAREIGPPHGKAWGYRARHGCAPAPGHHDQGAGHRGKGH